MTNLSDNEQTVDSGEQGGFGTARNFISGAGGAGSSRAGSDLRAAGQAGLTAGEDAEAGVASFLGGGLQKAYILILPPAPEPGVLAAAQLAGEVAAAIAVADVAGSAGTNSDVEAVEAQTVGEVTVRIDFAFNPTRYNITKGATWTHLPDAGSYPTASPTYVGSGQRSMSMEVFLDESYSKTGSVKGAVDLLFATLTPTRASIAMESPLPPAVIFGWGETLAFLAYMDNVSAEFTHFRQDGTPTRAACTISMKEIPVTLPSQNPTSGGRTRRTRQTIAGDSLASLSHRELGRPTYWRAIAETNGIEDPTRIPAGTTLLIPPKTDAAGMA